MRDHQTRFSFGFDDLCVRSFYSLDELKEWFGTLPHHPNLLEIDIQYIIKTAVSIAELCDDNDKARWKVFLIGLPKEAMHIDMTKLMVDRALLLISPVAYLED